MKPLKFNIPKEMAADLEAVCDLGPEAFAKLRSALQPERPGIVKPSELRSLLSNVVAEGASGALYKLLLGLAAVSRDKHVPVETITQSLSEAIDARADAEPLASKWTAAKADVSALLKSETVLATTKALELAYEHDQFYVTGKILTDVRPVFNDTKTGLVGAVLNQIFKIEYDDPSGRRSNLTLAWTGTTSSG